VAHRFLPESEDRDRGVARVRDVHTVDASVIAHPRFRGSLPVDPSLGTLHNVEHSAAAAAAVSTLQCPGEAGIFQKREQARALAKVSADSVAQHFGSRSVGPRSRAQGVGVDGELEDEAVVARAGRRLLPNAPGVRENAGDCDGVEALAKRDQTVKHVKSRQTDRQTDKSESMGRELNCKFGSNRE
jgi:hypothetical protein